MRDATIFNVGDTVRCKTNSAYYTLHECSEVFPMDENWRVNLDALIRIIGAIFKKER